MRWLKQSTSVDVPIGPFLDETDGKTPETGLTITQPDVRLKKNGAAWAQKAAAQTLSHEENGFYEVTLDATDTNTLGLMRLAVLESGALPVWEDFMVVAANIYDSLVGGGDVLDVSVTQWLGTAAATPTVAGVPEVDLTHIAGAAVNAASAQLGVNVVQISSDSGAADNAEAFFDGTGYVGGTIKLGVDMVAISGDATAADNLEAYSDGTTPQPVNLTHILGTAAATPTVAGVLEVDVTHFNGVVGGFSVAGMPDVNVERIDTGATGPTHLNYLFGACMVSGISDSGSTTTMVDAARTEGDVDYWKGCWLVFRSGNVVGEARLITGFDPTTDTITFTPATTQAVATQSYLIVPAALVGGIGGTLQTLDALDTAQDIEHDATQAAIAALNNITAAAVWAAGTRTLTALDEDSTTLDLDTTIRAAVGLAVADLDTQLAAIAAKTGSLTFTEAGLVDSNVHAVNDITVGGAGTEPDPWGPA